MKNFIIPLALFLFPVLGLAQTSESSVLIPSSRETQAIMYGYACEVDGKSDTSTPVSFDKQIRFTVLSEIVAEDSIFYVIHVWAAPTNYSISNFNNDFVTDGKERKFFRIPKSQLEKNSKPLYSTRWDPVAGPLTIPVKLRFNQFRYSSDVSFGAAVGAQRRFSRYSEGNRVVTLFSTGITSITLDSATTEGQVSSTKQVPAFYLSAGAVINLRNNFTIGFFTGYDFLSFDNRNNWIYNGKPWIGLGVGVSMFDLGKSNRTDEGEQNK